MKPSHSVNQRVTDFSQMDPEMIFVQLKTTEEGLTDDTAEKYRKRYGENILVGQKKTTAHLIRISFFNNFSIILLLLAVISFFTDFVFAANYSRNIITFVIIIAMLVVSGTIRLTREIKAKHVTQQLLKLVHTTVRILRNGQWHERSSAELAVGDILRLDAGDRAPADIRILRAGDFFVSQSVITGESGVFEKTADALDGRPESFDGYTNTVFCGSNVIGGWCEGVVAAVGDDTLYGGFSREKSSCKNSFDRGENAVAWTLIRFMVILVPIVFVASGLTKGNWLEAFVFALSVAIGLTPELLPMVITSCLVKGSFLMGRKQTIVKNTNAMQSFGSMDMLCVDKTGTLTSDRLLLEYYMDILGNESRETLDAAYINSAYHTGVANHLDRVILTASNMPGEFKHFSGLLERVKKLDELPFDYDRKFASVLVESGGLKALLVKGGVDHVIARCDFVSYRGERHMIGDDADISVHEVVDEMLEEGMKVLAVAAKPMDKSTVLPEDEYGMTLIGFLAFFDGPKQSAASAIDKLKGLHIGIKVLTGDHEEVAVSICRRLGIPTDQVMTGARFAELDENDRPMAVERTEIFAELAPRQKSEIVGILQDNGHSVGFLGDGMNDLYAIAQADVGISVDTASDAVKDSADVILLKKDLNVLEEGVKEGRKAFANMSKYLKITASSNFGNILAIVVASVVLPFYPMTAVQLVLLDLIYDILCLVLPWDNVDASTLENPLDWSGWTLGRFMFSFGPASTVLDLVTFAFMFFWLCPFICGGNYGTLDAAGKVAFIAVFQTGWFLESLWTQILIIHLLRTRRMPFKESKPSRQVVIVTILGLAVFTLFVFSPVGKWVGLTGMPLVFFGFLVLVVLAYMFLVSIVKRLYVKKHRHLI
ncbi:MAG: magnesium-translocating P-type ATPase [Clostridiales bacterium]|nr:magnesium-translocating P-type ATPase [Clostridiales bacterium]